MDGAYLKIDLADTQRRTGSASNAQPQAMTQ